MTSMFNLSRFLEHLFRTEKRDLSFRLAVLWSSSFLDCCRTSLILQISPATATNNPDFFDKKNNQDIFSEFS